MKIFTSEQMIIEEGVKYLRIVSLVLSIGGGGHCLFKYYAKRGTGYYIHPSFIPYRWLSM